MTTLRRIVVGVDGSRASTRALNWATELAATLSSEVVAVHALGLLAHLGPEVATPAPAQSHHDEVRQRFEEQWCAPLRTAGVSHRCVMVEGSPVLGLLAATADWQPDLIVVGRRGTGGFPGLKLGSTSQQLVEHAEVPVVVVPG